MTDFLSSSSFFAIALTLLIWRFAAALQKKTGSVLLHPILVSVLGIILILLASGIPNSDYQQGMKPFSWLMTPATVCLAVPLYEQVKVLKKNLAAICLGVLCGTLTSLLCIGGLCLLFRLDRTMTVSLLPKSVTTAIGAPVSEAMGGLGAVTVTAIIATGILGNIFGQTACRLLHIHDPVAQGTAFGTASHVIGTAKANETGAVQGAVSSLSLVIAGVLTGRWRPGSFCNCNGTCTEY